MNIDFVIPWVDGNDPAWQKEKVKYQGAAADDSNMANRFRDWGLLPYWFRAVEKYAPWVNKIHFVTWGHLPDFLNASEPRLHIVRHSDYIPNAYLPTFSANTIEMNVHRISGLAEHFVYFNDDVFLLRPMQKTDFFRDELPCTFGGEIPVSFVGGDGIWRHLIVNNLRIVNNHFNKAEQVRRFGKQYRASIYGWKNNLRTMLCERLYPECFLGFKNLHAPAPFLKSTFEEIWNKEQTVLDDTCRRRFRSSDDVNQWLALWWQVAGGNFSPYNTDNLVMGADENTVGLLCDTIERQSHDMLCINDPSDAIDFPVLSRRIQQSFEKILPKKSVFEK